MSVRNSVIALGVAATALFAFAETAEAGRITVVNNAGIVARVQWQVGDSFTGWNNLALGSSTFRDYSDTHPPVTVRIQHHTGFQWKTTNCNFDTLSANRNWNIELKGTAFRFTCFAS